MDEMILTERLYRLSEIGSVVPAVAHLHGRTLWRWVSKGTAHDGAMLRLDSVRIGGHIHTSAEAVLRFLATLNAKPAPTPPVRSPAQRQRDSERDGRELQRMGS